jgi:two-component system alkaline phosphatase synthesis response regulator PhoP
VLLIEDEPSLVLTLTDRLLAEGYAAETAADGETGYRRALEGGFDAIVLDVMLPGRNGWDVCRDLRAQGVRTPILMLTARGQVIDKVLGLKLGADDYLTKPFDMLELLARIEALLRRAGGPEPAAAPGTAAFGDVRVDLERQEVVRGAQTVELSALEFKLLRYFLEHRGAVLSREVLLDEVWGYDAMPYTRTVDVHVAALRQKLEPDPARPRYIQTVHRRGYKFTR